MVLAGCNHVVRTYVATAPQRDAMTPLTTVSYRNLRGGDDDDEAFWKRLRQRMELAGEFSEFASCSLLFTLPLFARTLCFVLMEIGETHKKVQAEMEENRIRSGWKLLGSLRNRLSEFRESAELLTGGDIPADVPMSNGQDMSPETHSRKFHHEIVIELEKKTEMDVKYMNATFKRYQSEHKVRQDSLERSQTDLKKLRRKSQGKNSSKYDIKENEYMETISSRQTDIQRFMAEGCKEALVEEKRRFCFLVDKHCMLSAHIAAFHDKARELLAVKLPSWQEKCSDATRVPDTVLTQIQGPLTPDPRTPSPLVAHNNQKNVQALVPPPAPQLKAQISPLANMFNPEPHAPLVSPPQERKSDQGSLGEGSLSSSVSQSSSLDAVGAPRTRVRTIFPHQAGNNATLLSFDQGDVIGLLLQDERDGWLYGEMETTNRY
ncbi:hypothetical protein CRUP_024250 [Coryphaenoides rupestris]|nr:hypothetical protein CRUP_024250 [Coryphaenoides rupestris]